MKNRKEMIGALLKGIETGDPQATEVVNSEQYIQHNPQTVEGGEGLAALFKRLSKTSPKVNIVRLFEDNDFVFGHTEYEFSSSRVGFEVFRFEGDQTVEHWDNIQARRGPNPSGNTMVDGPTEVEDRNKTEVNRSLVQSFIDEVLINRDIKMVKKYVHSETFIEHNPRITNGVEALSQELSLKQENGNRLIEYSKIHRVLADGEFVLSVCEGHFNSVHTSFYDLFRVKNQMIVEHWDTVESVPPRSEWKNQNGKF